MNYFVIGAGIWGCVIAERIASQLNEPVTLVERRGHIGGNCYSEIDAETGIECHRYGSHIFHTSIPEVAEYIGNFCKLTNYRHKVLTRHKGHVYFMPINLATINDFYGLDLTPAEAGEFIEAEIKRDYNPNPANLEEKAISLIGRPLYEAFIKEYTAKQWEREPADLPAFIINRLPFRLNYDVGYFNDPVQGVPLEGYKKMFESILANPNIRLELNTDFKSVAGMIPADALVFYSGMPDELFDFKHGRLDWRSLHFEWERLPVRDFQGTTVMNYADIDVPYTRIHEFKHYHPERKQLYDSGQTVICREYPRTYSQEKEAYYPVNDAKNMDIYQKYRQEAGKNPNLVLGGRLGAYKYWDMDKAIADALHVFGTKIMRKISAHPDQP